MCFLASKFITCLSTLLLLHSNYMNFFLVPQVQQTPPFLWMHGLFLLKHVSPHCLSAGFHLSFWSVWKLSCLRSHARPPNPSMAHRPPTLPFFPLLFPRFSSFHHLDNSSSAHPNTLSGIYLPWPYIHYQERSYDEKLVEAKFLPQFILKLWLTRTETCMCHSG